MSIPKKRTIHNCLDDRYPSQLLSKQSTSRTAVAIPSAVAVSGGALVAAFPALWYAVHPPGAAAALGAFDTPVAAAAAAGDDTAPVAVAVPAECDAASQPVLAAAAAAPGGRPQLDAADVRAQPWLAPQLACRQAEPAVYREKTNKVPKNNGTQGEERGGDECGLREVDVQL